MEITYGDIAKVTPRGIARHAALDALSFYSLMTGKMKTALRSNRVQFLYFHHVFKDEEESFGKLLSELSNSHRFISYSQGVERILSGNIDAPYLTVSFDDGIGNCLRASQIMDEFGIKGCFFVCPAIIGERNPEKIAAFSKNIVMPALKYLDWDDINTMVRNGHEIGGHTLNHLNLAQLSGQMLVDEIGGSYEALKARLGGVAHFAWPFGRFAHFSPQAARVVFDGGYQSCASAERGCHTVKIENARDLCIRRDSILAKTPPSHVYYFFAKNYSNSFLNPGGWPSEWCGGAGS
ncbi:MAG: polysaccharide deacetylase family protein [Nitrospinae bacterium]|nr:polysaccharide deacetylase family protein [Nitrospinota bacterium]